MTGHDGFGFGVCEHFFPYLGSGVPGGGIFSIKCSFLTFNSNLPGSFSTAWITVVLTSCSTSNANLFSCNNETNQ